MMPDDASYAPKYVQIIETLRRRIADGTYAVGELLPSEAKLLKEFGTSRPTVVRALNEMALRGEIEREHGRGTFVKAPPASASEHSRSGLSVLDRHETEAAVQLVSVGRRAAPGGIATLLGLAESAPVLLRRLVGTYDSTPSDLVSLWVPLDVAQSTGLEQEGPLAVSARQLLAAGLSARLVRIDERIAARRATSEERKLLKLGANEPVLVVVGSVLDAAQRTVLVVEVVLPGSMHELSDSYPI
ncbi:GntR family transcriptional regulator [Spirillospora sp. NPDC029432]|uniref:GntR family transcriptional regulator n=1 Tax=Spirillospora sp. NPDC029432 TaxID=3154599 RepID=UPI0034517E8A